MSLERIRDACRARGQTLTRALACAAVSRNAFYTLARRESVLPRSLCAVAAVLGVSPAALLTDNTPREERMKRLLTEVDGIVRRHPGADRDNIRHALLALQRSPLERLQTALSRAP